MKADRVAMVVEDEPLILMEAADLLEEDGFRVLEAWNADRALEMLLEAGGVDLVFTDVHMPGRLDGFALAREVESRWPATKIVVCSGAVRPGPGDMPGTAVFINKPFSPRLVRETIASLVA